MDAVALASALALLLLVCAHFQMTQALIKIIIAAAPQRGSTAEAAQIKTWLKQARRHALFFLPAKPRDYGDKYGT